MDDYKAIGKRLKELRENRGETQEDVGRLIGTTKYAIYQYERGRNRISLVDLQKIADHYGVSLAYFTGREPLRDEDPESVRLRVIREGVEKLYGEVQQLRPRSIPVVTYPAAHAGWPGLEDAELVEVDQIVIGEGNFAIDVRGESLRDVGIEPGDRLVIEESQPRNGDLVLVQVGDGVVVKYWFRMNSEIELRSSNNSRPIRTREAKAIGIVRHIIRRAPRWGG